MSSQEAPLQDDRQVSTRAFHAVYLAAIGVATVGWAYFLGYCGLALLGY
jgi:hypothetical protein